MKTKIYYKERNGVLAPVTLARLLSILFNAKDCHLGKGGDDEWVNFSIRDDDKIVDVTLSIENDTINDVGVFVKPIEKTVGEQTKFI